MAAAWGKDARPGQRPHARSDVPEADSVPRPAWSPYEETDLVAARGGAPHFRRAGDALNGEFGLVLNRARRFAGGSGDSPTRLLARPLPSMDRGSITGREETVHQNKKVTILAASFAAVGLSIAGQVGSAASPPIPIVAKDLVCAVPAGCVSGSEIVDHSVGPQDLNFTVATSGDLASETAARIAGDNAANSARIAGDNAANSAREAGDTTTNQRITDLAAPASGAGDTVHWSRVTGVPADLADGDDGVTFAHIHVVSTVSQLRSAAAA